VARADPFSVQAEIMIELLEGFPDYVTAFALHGQVTKSDYDTVLIPDFEDKLRRHKKLRIYFEISPDLKGFDPGAVWEDTKLGFSHFFDWERCAVVTDVEWAKYVAQFSEFFGFLWPGEYRAFPKAQASKAREWVSQGRQ
jgi:SpoIIAA-like